MECDESYCIEGDHIWSFFRRGCEDYFTMSHSARRSSWPYVDFNFFCDVSFGVGLCPYMAYGRGLPIYGDATTPQVYRVHKKHHTLLLVVLNVTTIRSRPEGPLNYYNHSPYLLVNDISIMFYGIVHLVIFSARRLNYKCTIFNIVTMRFIQPSYKSTSFQ